MRPSESQGNPYHFISKKQFEDIIAKDEFIECRKYNTLINGTQDIWYYGIHKDSINLTKK
jgi:guanylate kinase